MQRARAWGQTCAQARQEVPLGGGDGRDGLYFALGGLGVCADWEGVGGGAAEGCVRFGF
jgi:hypothetical protein